MLFGWLIPLIIVMFNLCFEYENYGGDYHCWLQMDTNLIYGQFVPIAFMTIISLAIIEAAGEGAGSKKLQNVNEQQRTLALQYIERLERQKTFEKITTTIEKMTKFYPAEKYHQDFVKNNPYHPYVMSVSKPRKLKFLKQRKNP